MESHAHPASAGLMLLFTGGMLLTYVGVAHERLHKTVAALAGAVVLVVLAVWAGVFDYSHVYEILRKDLNVLGVIVGTGILVQVTGKSGLFHVLSLGMVRLTGGLAGRLWLAVMLLTFLFVTFLTIVPAMLIVTSLILVICRTLGYAPRAFLIGAAICANSGALATLASGLPNLMIGAAADLPYVHFLRVSGPYALVSLVVALLLLRRAFRTALPWRQSSEEADRLGQKVQEFDPWALVESRAVLVRSGLILVFTILGFAFAGRLGVGLDFVAVAGGTAALLFAGRSVDEAISKVNWTVILFFVGLFLMIGCVEATGALEWVAGRVLALSGGSDGMLLALMTVFSAVASAVVDNIPVAATLVPVVKSLAGSGVEVAPLWWALVLGCNLGGNGTPIGSIASVIALHALHDETHEHVSWVAFIKLGGAIMVVQLVGAVAYLLLLQSMGWLP